jgi:hypothetical protein
MPSERRPASRAIANAGTIAGSSASWIYLFFVLLLGLRVGGFFQALHSLLHFGAKRSRASRYIGVGERLHLRLERVNLVHHRLDALDVALVLGADEACNDVIYDSFDLHLSWSSCLLADEPTKQWQCRRAGLPHNLCNTQLTIVSARANSRKAGIPR